MMKSTFVLCCGILALTAVISAQTPQSATPSSNPVTARQSSQTDVVTGCVSADPASEPGATSRRFILSNAQWLTDESGQGRQTAATNYLLTNSDLNLSDHVGHKVQLTGYVDSSSTGASSASSPGSTSSQSMRVFHATSVRMLSQTCP